MISSCAAQSIDELSQSNEWKALLHISDNNVSEINDLNFFISHQTNPKLEMETLLNKKNCENICKYPARYRYLSKAFDLNISFEHCTNLNRYLDDSKGDNVSIVFASSFLESPTSYFGHTFIKINKRDNAFFSQTLGYAAELPQNVGIFSLISKGIGGGFTGKYISSPYFKLIEEYSNMEQRTLFEYELDLSKEEIDNLIWHSYEMLSTKVPYRFFSENCAYEVFWFLENARPNSRLIQRLKPYVIPYATIELLKDEHLIKSTLVREPKIEHLSKIYFSMTNEEKNLFDEFKNYGDKLEYFTNKNVNKDVKNKVIELTNGYYDILFKKFRIVKSDYDDVKNMDYNQSKPTVKKDFEYKKQSSVYFGRVITKSDNLELLGFRPAMFSRYEPQNNLLNEQSLEFLKVELEKKHNNDIKLNKFDLINLESMNKQFSFYEPKSWRFYLGANKSFANNKVSPVGEFGIGLTRGTEYFSFYGLGQVAIYPLNESVQFQGLAGTSLWLGKIHLNYDLKRLILSTKDQSKDMSIMSINYYFNDSFSLSFAEDLFQDEKRISIMYKF